MSTKPVPPSTITTPRLHLIRLTNTSPGSQHVQWFHENWSDPVATSWRYRPHLPIPSSYSYTTFPVPVLLALKHQSLHGATKTLDESRKWMEEHMEKWDNWFYAVFLHDAAHPDGLGEHIGSVSLRHQDSGPTLPPPQTFEGAEEVGTGAPLSEEEVQKREKELEDVRLELRVLGYALFDKFHGKGYVTEACRSLLEAYSSVIADFQAQSKGDEKEDECKFYVEAGVDVDNPGSQKVLRKLGFKTVGMKIEKDKAWLNGGWRGPGWWITGMYL